MKRSSRNPGKGWWVYGEVDRRGRLRAPIRVPRSPGFGYLGYALNLEVRRTAGADFAYRGYDGQTVRMAALAGPYADKVEAVVAAEQLQAYRDEARKTTWARRL